MSLDRLAWHQAGHAVAAARLGLTVPSVGIDDVDEHVVLSLIAAQAVIGDWTTSRFDDDPVLRDRIDRMAVASLAGEEAELLHFEVASAWSDWDFEHATQCGLLLNQGVEEVSDAYLWYVAARARHMVHESEEWVRAVALSLVEEGELTGQQVLAVGRKVLERTPPRGALRSSELTRGQRGLARFRRRRG